MPTNKEGTAPPEIVMPAQAGIHEFLGHLRKLVDGGLRRHDGKK